MTWFAVGKAPGTLDGKWHAWAVLDGAAWHFFGDDLGDVVAMNTLPERKCDAEDHGGFFTGIVAHAIDEQGGWQFVALLGEDGRVYTKMMTRGAEWPDGWTVGSGPINAR